MTPFLIALLTVGVALFFYLRARKRGRKLDEEIKGRSVSKLLGPTVRDFGFWAATPAQNFLVRNRVSPTLLNITGMLLSGVAGFCFLHRLYGWGALILCLGGACDMLDGRVARALKVDDRVGAFMDATMDRIGEVLAFAGILLSSRDQGFHTIVFFAATGAQMVSYIRAKGEAFGIPVKTGFMQRPERLVLWILFTLTAEVWLSLFGLTPEAWLSIGFGIVAIGAWWTTVHRVLEALKLLRRGPDRS